MVLNWLLAMLSLVVSWVGLGALFGGCGFLIFRLKGTRVQNASDLLNAFWLGWGACIFSLIAWNFYYPIKGPAFGIFALLGIAGCLIESGALVRLLREWITHRKRELLVCAALWLLAAMLVANRALGGPLNAEIPINPDMGLYYASSVRYAVEYPALPGVGNLHTRLAYNNSTFLYAALLESGLWTHRSHHVASGLPLLVMLARILLGGVRFLLPRDASPPALSSVFSACFVAPWIALLLGRDIACPGPDLCVYVVGFELCVKLLEFFELADRRTPGLAGWPLFYVVFLGALGVSHKLSFAVLGGLAGILAVIVCLRRAPDSVWRGFAVSLLFALLAGGLWGSRSVVLSGYPLYPNTSIDLQKDWAIPKITGIQEVKSVVRSARNNKGDFEETARFGNWDWVTGWLNKQISRNQRFYTVVPFILALGFAIAAGFASHKQNLPRIFWWAFVPLYGAMAFWFLTAPHPRFAGVIFWGPCVLAFSYWLVAAGFHTRVTPFKAGFVAATLFALITSLAIPVAYSPLFTGPQHPRGFTPLPEPEMKRFVTHTGLVLWQPAVGSYSFYAPLLCTPYPNPYVKLRKKDDVLQGFSVDPEYVKLIEAQAAALSIKK